MEDKGNLEYQAGQEESEPAQDQQQRQEKDQAATQEEGEPEEQLSGQEAVNNDTEDKYEDRQFAAPQVSPPDLINTKPLATAFRSVPLVLHLQTLALSC